MWISGSYALPQDMVLGADESGTPSVPILILGPAASGGHAVLDRGTTAAGSAVLRFAGAHDVTLRDFDLVGGADSIDVSDHAGSSDVHIENNTLTGLGGRGVYVGLADPGFELSGSTITGSTSAPVGVEIAGSDDQSLISGNTIVGFATGIEALEQSNNLVIDGNSIINSDIMGIDASSDGEVIRNNTVSRSLTDGVARIGIVATGTGTVSGNIVSGYLSSSPNNPGTGFELAGATALNNQAFNNDIGFQMSSGSATGNVSRDNTKYGFEVAGGTLIGNTAYGNDAGIFTSNDPNLIENDLIYGNRSEGVFISGASSGFGRSTGAVIRNNTIDQSGSDGVRIINAVFDGVTTLTFDNNIVRQEGGTALSVDASSEAALVSDFNLWDLTGGAVMASWNNHLMQTPLDARFQLGLDQHSLAADPLFVDPATGNYHLRPNSPAIDAGDPATPCLLEPAPNGDRVNLGFDGNTPDAASSPTQMLQVLSPSGFDKLVEGQPATITWRSYGIAAERPVMFINAGSSTVTGPQAWSSWSFDPNGTLLGHQWTSLPIDTSGIDLPAPQAVYQTVAQAPNGIGNKLDYSLDLPDGDYIVRLHFSEEGGPFDILINGAVAASNFDIAAAEGTAGAVVERFTATASGGQGLHIQLVNRASFGATLAGIEISQVEHFGSATATAKVEVSPDGGNSWQLVTSSAPFDRYGYGSVSFAPTFQTAGNDALVRVTSGAGTDTSHGEFLVANAGHAYFINDGSTAGDEYTTAIGDDRNSGKSPDQPMATLSALLAAYPLEPGDIVYVDTGHYLALRDIVIGPSVSGNGDDPGQRVTIQGPTQGADKAVFDRGDTSDNTAIFHIAGADFLTLADLDITDGTRGIWVTNNTGTTNGLRITGSDIFGNSLYDVEIDGGSVTIDHSRVFGPGDFGIGIVTGTVTISDTEVFGLQEGIEQANALGRSSNVLIERVNVHDNSQLGIALNDFSASETVADSRISNNGSVGVALAGTNISVVNSQVFGQSGASAYGITLSSGATASDDDIYGNTTGVLLDTGAHLLDSRVFANTGSGVSLFGNSSVIGNRIYSNATGISGSSADIENNLVYANSLGAIQMSFGQGGRIIGNTIYQSVGDAVVLNGARNVTFHNNIVWDDVGNVLNITAAGAAALDSNFNLFWRGAGGTAKLGVYNGSSATDLAAWRTLTGMDASSREGDPRFRNIAGADGVFAGPDTALGGGADDNFEVSRNSPAIDAGDSSVASPTDMLGEPRVGVADISALEFQGNSTDTTPPTVTGIGYVPANGGTTDLAFNAIPITFSKPLDRISATSTANYALVAAGPDGRFDTADDVKIGLIPTYASNPSTVTLSLSNGPLPDGTYRLTLSGSRAIFDASGNALDGDGDGVAGGDLVRIFTIDRSANRAPVVPSQTANLVEDTPASVALSATDPDGDALTFTILNGPLHGAVSGFDPTTGQLTYTPYLHFNGNDTLTFQADDGKLGITKGVLTLDVAAVNARPIAVPQSVNAIANVGQLITLAGSDEETASQDLLLQIASGPAHGTLAIVGQNQVLYTAHPNFSGTDSFTFTWTDNGDPAGSGNNPLTSAPAQVTIAVTKINHPPVAIDVGFATPEDVPLVISTATLLFNDSDPDLDPLTVVSVTNPTRGLVSYQNQTITFTPDFNSSGIGGFEYTISDGALTATAHVVVTVIHGDAAPKALSHSGSTLENTPLIVDPGQLIADASDIDGDTLSVAGASNPTNGTIAFDSAAARYVFTPTTYFTGAAGFDYSVTDGTLARTAHVTINVIPVNQPPVAADDIVTASKHDVPVVIAGSTLLANDTDVDGDTLSIASVGNALDGTVSYDPQSGNVTFTPTTGFAGKAGFDYMVTDGSLTSTARVTVVIPNTAPVIQFQPSFIIPVNTGIGTFTGFQATDADGDTVTFRLKDGSGPFLGVVNVTPDGNFNYQSTGLTGKDQFTVIADDGHGGTAEATGTIAVTDSSNVAYFTSQVPGFTPSTELWRVGSDGVASPQTLFESASPVGGFTAFNSIVYFSADDGGASQLWVIDGGQVNNLSNGDIDAGIVGLVAPGTSRRSTARSISMHLTRSPTSSCCGRSRRTNRWCRLPAPRRCCRRLNNRARSRRP